MIPKHFTLVFVSVPLQCSLHKAARQGDLNEVKALVEKGAGINAKDDNGVCKNKGNFVKMQKDDSTLLFDIIRLQFVHSLFLIIYPHGFL